MKALQKHIIIILISVLSLMQAMAAEPVKLRTVVIDPGHGGHDSGCISRDGSDVITTEKFLTLDISTRFAEKIRSQYPDVKVLLTREEDTYVTLSGRADVANNAGADLFISIHINAAASGTRANGYSVHCLGQSSRAGNDLFSKNLELCKRENSVIKLEDDYQTKYQGFDPSDPQSYIFFSLLQNSNLNMSLAFAEDVNAAMAGGPVRNSRGVSQDPFWVLWRTAMPAVLIECAFITNPEDLATLRSETGRDGIAECLLKAFGTYKNRYEGSMAIDGKQPENPAPATSETPAETSASQQTPPEQAPEQPAGEEPAVLYGTQVIATPKALAPDDPFFHGYVPVAVQGEKLTRYVIGTSADPAEAKKKNEEIRKIFADSFMVKIEGNQTRRFL